MSLGARGPLSAVMHRVLAIRTHRRFALQPHATVVDPCQLRAVEPPPSQRALLVARPRVSTPSTGAARASASPAAVLSDQRATRVSGAIRASAARLQPRVPYGTRPASPPGPGRPAAASGGPSARWRRPVPAAPAALRPCGQRRLLLVPLGLKLRAPAGRAGTPARRAAARSWRHSPSSPRSTADCPPKLVCSSAVCARQVRP